MSGIDLVLRNENIIISSCAFIFITDLIKHVLQFIPDNDTEHNMVSPLTNIVLLSHSASLNLSYKSKLYED